MLSKLVKTLHVSLNKEIELGNWHLLTRTLVVQGNEAALFSQTKAFLKLDSPFLIFVNLKLLENLKNTQSPNALIWYFTDFIHM